MVRRIIDLSVTLKAGLNADPPGSLKAINYTDNATGAAQLAAAFPGLSVDQLPRREGWAVEFVEMGTHVGTHMDAPYHYHSHMDDGSPSLTIDQIPLEWCIGPAVKLDFRHLVDGYVVQPAEIDAELDRIGHTLKAGDIVLINTSAGTRYEEDDFMLRGCGVGRAGTLHLTGQGVRVVGTDGWSWDAPFKYTAERYARNHDPSIIWEGHFAGSVRPYCQIEKLSNLDSLPPNGFTVFCLPVKIHRASAGWCRPIAIIED
jgi:kynurenine formamidase